LLGILSLAGNIASISDYVFRWKGFILNGVNFYRLWIRDSLAELANHLGWNVTSDEFDPIIFATILAITIMVNVRRFVPLLSLSKLGTAALVSLIVAVPVLNIYIELVRAGYFELKPQDARRFLMVSLFTYLLYGGIFVHSSRLVRNVRPLVAIKEFFLPGVIALTLVFITAAVSEGISRTS